MNRLATAVATGVIIAATALAIVWVITFIRDASFIDAVRQPRFWLVEGAVMAIAVFVVLSKSSGDTATTRLPMRRVAEHVAWSAVAAIAIGMLLAVATDTSIRQLVISIEFLIPAGIALLVAALEAWPNNRPES